MNRGGILEYLDEFKVGDALEAGVEKGNLLYFETIDPVRSVDVYTIADVVWVLDKEEDARAEKCLGCY
jgi:hypothetical protein